MANPRKEVEAMRVEQERGKRHRVKWLAATPKAIARVWSDSVSEVGGVVDILSRFESSHGHKIFIFY
jgi:hypothetical protein